MTAASPARPRDLARRAPSLCARAGRAAAFLLRLARVIDTGLTTPVVDRPDKWWAVPARLRTVHTGPQIPPGRA